MSTPIARLVEFASAIGLNRDAVIRALYVLRAPRSLAGLVIAVESFEELRGRFPELGRFDQIPDYDQRLQNLIRLAEIAQDDPQFAGHGLRRTSERQLEPHCGDSGIVDALLARQSAEGAILDDRFRSLVAWFAWQAIRFNRSVLRESEYADYLDGKLPSLREFAQGHSLYAAWLQLRRLGHAGNEHLLRDMTAILIPFGPERTARHSLFIRLANSKADHITKPLVGSAARKYGLVGPELETQVTPFRGLDWKAVGAFVQHVWFPSLQEDAEAAMVLHRRFLGREVLKPQLRRYRDLAEVTTPLDVDGVRKGVVVEYFPTGKSKEAVEEDDDPDTDDAGVEPLVSVYLAEQKDLLKGYFAARGLQSATEYNNALLPWARWRLSTEALAEIDQVVVLREGEDDLTLRARLAIGLSLIGGRPLLDVARPIFSDQSPELDEEHPIGIALGDGTLHALAATPELVNEPSMLDFCWPRTDRVRLSLPDRWRPLIDRCAGIRRIRGEEIAKKARALLAQLPKHLAVTEQAVRRALATGIQAETRGDLGAIKAITNATDANFQNLIHYAAYSVRDLGEIWRKAAEALLGPLAQCEFNEIDHVGAPHAFNIDELNGYFEEIRKRFEDRLAVKNYPAAFNYMTLQTALWMALATAGRKTTKPIPRIILANGWALVDDKHRHDGSTDRLTPISRGARAQLRAWLDLATHLSITHPTLDAYEVTDDGYSIRLHYVDRHGIAKPYQPKIQEGELSLTPLPGNWARKLLRSEAGDLSGRMVDAGSGHGVRGRHPWRSTSTLSAPEFRQEWLHLQRSLEKRLGLRVLRIREVPRSPCVVRPGRKPVVHVDNETAEAPILDAQQIRDDLRAAGPKLHALVFDTDSPPPMAALELVQKFIAQDERKASRNSIAERAEAACELIRAKTKIPIYAGKPRRLMARDWMTDADAFQCLAWMEHWALPEFDHDLGRLPPPGTGLEADRIELGRLVMIAGWKMGIARTPMLEPVLQWMMSDRPILATGSLRYFCIDVPCRRGGEMVSRTLFLNDYVAAYVLVERHRLRTILRRFFGEQRRRVRNRTLEQSLIAYLQSLNVPTKGLRLSATLAAAGQYFMIHGSPILAAYAQGDFATTDLGDAELRRLAGLEPNRASIVPAGRRLSANLLGDDPDSDDSDDDEERVDGDLPKDLKLRDRNFVRALSSHKTGFFKDLVAAVRGASTSTDVEKLLQEFALWLLIEPPRKKLESRNSQEEDEDAPDPSPGHEKPRGAPWSPKVKKRWTRRVAVIGYALLGISEMTSACVIEGAELERLEEASNEFFTRKQVRSAWRSFRSFLRNARAKKKAKHVGFEVNGLPQNNERYVSAQILSAGQIEACADLLLSPRSGIGNPGFRVSAARLFRIAADVGARRGELEALRRIDVQGNLIRIQPYLDHTLKTSWSERVIPLGMLSRSAREHVDLALAAGVEKVIDPEEGVSADGRNFFHAMNQVIQWVTGGDLGIHHLRHTMPSRLLLTLLQKGVDLWGVFTDFPWIEALLIDPDRTRVLDGNEGPSGHGMQAVSAMLGHGHTTTTLRHYVHTIGIAFYALLRKVCSVDITMAFVHRHASPSTIHRWAVEACKDVDPGREGIGSINRKFRQRLEASLVAGLDIDERKADTPIAPPIVEEISSDDQSITYKRLELMDREFRGEGAATRDPWADCARIGFALLEKIPSGKRNSRMPRHPLVKGPADQWVPERLPAKSATRIAVDLGDWLEALRKGRPEHLDWLLDRWTYGSHRNRGEMHLKDDLDLAIARALRTKDGIDLQIEHARISKARQKSGKQGAWQLRIRCKGKGPSDHDTAAVRWTLSWLAAIKLGRRSAV